MITSQAVFTALRAQGAEVHARVTARDDVYLMPTRLSQAAAARLRAGIAALESWVRRLLILLALEMEPALTAPAPYNPVPRRALSWPRARSLRLFTRGETPAWDTFDGLGRKPKQSGAAPVRAAPLLARLAALKALVDAPEARARRLAWLLARRRPGRLFAPVYRGPSSGRLFGPFLGAVHDGMAAQIVERSRARPPPLGPAIRVGPRIRQVE